LGILPEQITDIEKTRKETTHLTIHAPIGGVVVEKNVREQQYVKEGDMLYRIAELDPIWLYLDIYEYDLGWIRYGQPVDVTVEAYPGEVFHGTVVFIDPYLNDASRTVKVRVNLKNPDYRLKAAMYASAVIHASAGGWNTNRQVWRKYICPMHPEAVADGGTLVFAEWP
jgi:Cu(I)/Ag(I) efflux system membrane fusion protein